MVLQRKVLANILNKAFCNGGVLRVPHRAASLTTGDYEYVYKNSIEKREEFYDELGKKLTWHTPYTSVLDPSGLPTSPNWYTGGQLNTCYNAVDRHVENGHGDRLAIIYDSPVTETVTKMTYSELLDQVRKMAYVLMKNGVKTGDKVLIYMPMVAESLVAMLACTRIGAVHSVVFGGFAAQELSARIGHLKPKVIVSASCGIEPSRVVQYKPLLDTAIKIASHKPAKCIILQRPNLPKASIEKDRDVTWAEEMDKAVGVDAVPVDSNHPCYVLYTSGTTGSPKGIVRPTAGHAVVLPWTMKTIYDMEEGETWWAASDLGWVVGHSYICYAPLLNGNTTIVYEGKPVGTPDSHQFFRVIEQHDVRGMFTAPTALRAIKQANQEATFSGPSNLRHVFIAGETLDNETRLWTEKAFKVPALDNWWQTETGYAISAHAVGLGMNPKPPRGTTGKPFPGYDVQFANSDGGKIERGELGRIVVKLPLPPGCMSTLHDAPVRFIEHYFQQFPGYYDTMDAGMLDRDGYVSVLSRLDDVINVAGHRLSTSALEEALLEHDDVIEAAVIGVPDDLKGVVPLGLVVLNKPREEAEVTKELVDTVREHVGPVAAFRLCAVVEALPKTRSGKTPRGSIASLARGETVTISPTIEDPAVYGGVLRALQRLGLAIGTPAPQIKW